MKRPGILLMILLLMVATLVGCAKPTAEEAATGFVEALNEGDQGSAAKWLAPSMVYTEKYGDGSQFVADDKSQVQMVLSEIIDNDTTLTMDEVQASDNNVVIKGTAKDYITGIVGMTDGLRYTMDFAIVEGKISRITFQRDKEDEAALNQRTGGTVGIAMNEADAGLVVEEVVPGSPADMAGLQPGDLIEAVDGVTVAHMAHGVGEAVYRIRGTVGTTVTLTLVRDGAVFEVAVERK